ncbi:MULTISPECIES: hypothetical protein [unclassified Arthrobacter]|uniref:hypothetical protein n=1 Tax=unclassified Arthrobacter TaxID=235627 RepID=UPI002DFD7377|nr:MULTISPECIES: hypothetical protein [unclassified Arthrobacter]MEC5192102.1 hypothetical protein [Arthrobacter sp. MP_M4]MEC5203611.1 hypothetical protein [Arthrobacter sp. MP_M7]
MDTTGSRPNQPANDSLESDPAYDYAEDAPVGDAAGTEEEELFEEAERLVPLGEEDFLGEEKPVATLEGEEFVEPEEGE